MDTSMQGREFNCPLSVVQGSLIKELASEPLALHTIIIWTKGQSMVTCFNMLLEQSLYPFPVNLHIRNHQDLDCPPAHLLSLNRTASQHRRKSTNLWSLVGDPSFNNTPPTRLRLNSFLHYHHFVLFFTDCPSAQMSKIKMREV